jgi:hypothetical protein
VELQVLLSQAIAKYRFTMPEGMGSGSNVNGIELGYGICGGMTSFPSTTSVKGKMEQGLRLCIEEVEGQ